MRSARKVVLAPLVALLVPTATAAPLAALPGCSSQDQGSLRLVTGAEDAGATFEGVTQLSVTWVDSSGTSHPITTATLPTTSVDLGSLDETKVGMIEVAGLDANGHKLVFGSTIPLQFGALVGTTLSIFVQRTGQFARLPSPPADTRTDPVLGVVGGRYLVAAGGSGGAGPNTSELYDFASLQSLPSPPTVSPVPESMAIIGTVAYFVSSSSTWALDLSSNADAGFAPPVSSYGAGDLAGGATVVGSDGAQYIVGATRTTHGPTSAVLKIDTSGNVSWLTLSSPRWGAAAVWVDSLGLVVLGGSAVAPGLESIATTGTMGIANPAFGPDPTASAGAATLDDKRYVLLAGGLLPDGSDPGVRVLDLNCAAMGTPCTTPWAPLPYPLAWAQAFPTPSSTAAVVVGGEYPSRTMHAFVLTSTAATEVVTKVPHLAARAVPYPLGPTGSFLLYGGAAAIESFMPPDTLPGG